MVQSKKLPNRNVAKAKRRSLFFGLGMFLIFIAALSFIFRVFDKVLSDKGLDYYLTGHGVQFNYIGAMVLLLLLPLVIVVGLCFRYWQLRDERDFKRKFWPKKK